MKYRDRQEAGQKLGAALQAFAREHPIVLALPRGGVPVGYEVAAALRAPLDVWVVRKIGVPWHPELGLGAVAEGGTVHVSREILPYIGLSNGELSAAIATKRREVEARVTMFRGDRPRPVLRDRTVIVVDDGIATGGTMRVAVRSIRAEEPSKIVIAVPVASPDTITALSADVDRIVSLLTPSSLYAVGLWYEDFRQVSDDDVVSILERSRRELAGRQSAAAAPQGT